MGESSGRVRSRRDKNAGRAGKSDGPNETKTVEKRSTSNVFSMFSQAQIHEFKEKKEKKEKKKKKEEASESDAPADAGGEEAAPKAKAPVGNVFALFKQAQIQEFKEEKKEKKSKKKKDKTESDAAPEKAENGSEKESAKAEGGDGGEEPKRAKRATSNVFALFKQAQIQEFKEAFTMIDQDRDGLIGKGDLAAIYQQIGLNPDPKQLDEMLKEAPGQLNFTHFLTLFGEKMHGTDPEATLRDSFKMFDPEGTGKLAEEYVKDLLMNVGDQFSKDEVKQTWKEAPIEGGQLDYMKFVTIIKRGKEEE